MAKEPKLSHKRGPFTRLFGPIDRIGVKKQNQTLAMR